MRPNPTVVGEFEIGDSVWRHRALPLFAMACGPEEVYSHFPSGPQKSQVQP